ncbi:MAG: hypothetical protein ABIO29_07990 [Sphingomicrobium sp.]
MRIAILICAAALTLAACNKRDAGNMMDEANGTVAADVAATGDIDANAATNDAMEANMVMNDMTHNDADTNLANGM